jgi:proteasome lid subunit RPN8/RPN11
LYEEMLAQARAELPNECCGLLAGSLLEPEYDGVPRRGQVERIYRLVNEAASPTEYLSEPRSMFDAERDRRRRGMDLLAVYHSHPTSDPVPSRTDRERNYSVDVMNLIISLKTEPPRVAAWWLTETDYREAAWKLCNQ